MIMNLSLLITVAALIFAVILTVSWFNTAKAVREINEKVSPVAGLSLKEQGYRYEFAGNTDKALEYFKLAIYEDANSLMNGDARSSKRVETLLKKSYLPLIQRCGGEWPDFSIITGPSVYVEETQSGVDITRQSVILLSEMIAEAADNNSKEKREEIREAIAEMVVSEDTGRKLLKQYEKHIGRLLTSDIVGLGVTASSDVNMIEALEKFGLVESIRDITDENIKSLERAILSEKKSDIGSSYKIEPALDELVSGQADAVLLLQKYEAITSRSLLDDIRSISSNYDVIAKCMSVFIENEIVEKDYPHTLKETVYY